MKKFFSPEVQSVLWQLLILSLFVAVGNAFSTESKTGYLTTIWGDDFQNGSPPLVKYFLQNPNRISEELVFTDEALQFAGSLRRLNNQQVRIWLDNVGAYGQSSNSPLIVRRIEAIASAADQTAPALANGPQPWVSIMCKFSGNGSEPRDLSYFKNMYSSSYPGLDHYWREASYNRANVSNSNAYGWYQLPQPRSAYIEGGRLNFNLITKDCTAAADDDVFFPGYVGINFMFNDDLDGYAWGGSNFLTIDGQSKSYRVTWDPPWAYRSITVIAHEMGHGFGMPHSSGNYGKTYDNAWDVMSDAWSNCSNLTDPTYGCLGQHTIGYHRSLVGWINDDEMFTYSGISTTITLDRLTQPTGDGYLLAKIPIKGSDSHYYTVEVRKKIGYDRKLPDEAVIIHEVSENRSNGRDAYIVDIDNNGNTGDAGAIWTVGEMFHDDENGTCVSIMENNSSSYRVRIGCKSISLTPIYPLLLR